MVSLIICMITILLFIPIKPNFVYQLREKRKRRNEIVEFDLPTEENLSLDNIVHQAGFLAKDLGGQVETKLGHKVPDFGSQLKVNKNNFAEKATDIYNGSLADKTGTAYENFQYGYGKMGDGLSSLLHWLGQNVIKIGHNTGVIIRSGFHTIGDIVGDTVDTTEHLVGNGLIKGSEKVHASAIDLQRTSHNNSESLRHKLQQTSPQFRQSLTQLLGKFGDKLHKIGLDTFKQAYPT